MVWLSRVIVVEARDWVRPSGWFASPTRRLMKDENAGWPLNPALSEATLPRDWAAERGGSSSRD